MAALLASMLDGSRQVSQIRSWMRACRELHGEACVLKTDQLRLLEDTPRWLIDTQQECIVPGQPAFRYIALSYAWPETRDPITATPQVVRTLLLDNSSVSRFASPGFLGRNDVLAQIPSVIQYAINLTAALGERYLWVDRLCIVQDDISTGGTLSQVSKMDKIYAGAFLTIIAAASETTYADGLARGWPKPDRETQDTVPSHQIAEHSIDDKDARKRVHHLHNVLRETRWASRGWTYQEQILCKRAIVITDHGQFWDCRNCVWDDVHLMPGQETTGSSQIAEKGLRFSTRWWPDFDFYLDLICLYNGRQFSFPEDASLGCAGIMNALSSSFPGGFIHGMPRLFLDHALLWQPFGLVNRRSNQGQGDATQSTIPSWSWCGWQGYVEPHSLRSGLWYIDDQKARGRVKTLRTTNITTWRLLVDEDETLIPIDEPRMLDAGEYHRQEDVLPAGWQRAGASSETTESSCSDSETLYSHSQDPSTYFRQPLPLCKPRAAPNVITSAVHLVTDTRTAHLYPATVLRQVNSGTWNWWGEPHVSVFDDKTFLYGPEEGKHSPVLVLRQPNGLFGGLLRIMTEGIIAREKPIELIAISSGTVQARDLESGLEWQIYAMGSNWYSSGPTSTTEYYYRPEWLDSKGKAALLFNAEQAFRKAVGSLGPLPAGLVENVRRADVAC